MMAAETKKIWMDGKLVDSADAKVHVLNHTLHYGVGVFEGIRCYATPGGSLRRVDLAEQQRDIGVVGEGAGRRTRISAAGARAGNWRGRDDEDAIKTHRSLD